MQEAPSQPWHLQLCQDDSYWHKPIFDLYPSIIAHEYWRLFTLLQSGQTYGALMQLKDTLEVILKFPVLIAMSVIYHSPERSAAEDQWLQFALRKPLSLGDWGTLAIGLTKSPHLDKDLKKTLEIASAFQSEGVDNWRNIFIGHGALSFDTTNEFRKQVGQKLKFIKKCLPKFDPYYIQSRFYLDDGEHTLELKGKDLAREIKYTAKLYFTAGDMSVCLYPYILLNNQGIYFFDTYVPAGSKTKILDYPNGDKISNYFLTELNELHAQLSRDIGQSSLESEAADGETYSLLAEQNLERRNASDRIEPVEYLHERLTAALESDAKGIYLLQMERGTGKTTFVRSIDEQAAVNQRKRKKDSRYEAVSTRAFYVNDTYQYKIGHFIAKLSLIMQSNESLTPVIGGCAPYLNVPVELQRQAMAAFLNFYHREHRLYFGKDKLLFILDGVDEAPAGPDPSSILDFIPDTSLLDNGVYILITARTSAENTGFTNAKLTEIPFTDHFIIAKESLENTTLLRQYIETNKINEGSPARTEELLIKADYRFLYIRMLREIYQLTRSSLQTLPDGDELLSYYLDALKYQYSAKFFKGITRVLAIVGTALAPLTVKEIAYLGGEETVTFALLAYLADLNIFLKVERSPQRGNLISIAHKNMSEMIRYDFAADIKTMVAEWLQAAVFPPAAIETIHPGQAYLLAHLQKYHEAYGAELDASAIYQREYACFLLKLAKHSVKNTAGEYHLSLALAALDSAVVIFNALPNRGDSLKGLLATAYFRRGNIYRQLLRNSEAIADYDNAVSLMESIEHRTQKWRIFLARILNSRGNVTNLLRTYENAIADFNQSIDLLANPDETDENLVGALFNNRANSHRRQKEWEQAIADYSQSIIIREQMLADNTLKSKTGLALALRNRGWTYYLMQQPREGLPDLDRSLALYQEADLAGRPEIESKLAGTLVRRGIVLKKLKEYPRSMSDFNLAISISSRLYYEGRLLNPTALAAGLRSRASLNLLFRQFPDVEADCAESLALCEKLIAYTGQKNEPAPDKSRTGTLTLMANTYNIRGIAYLKQKKYALAADAFDKAIALYTDAAAGGGQKNATRIAVITALRNEAYQKSLPGKQTANRQ